MYEYLSDVQKKRLFTAVWLVFVFLALFLVVKAVNTMKEFSYIGKGVYAANVITVNGSGEVLAVPDTASFSFSVTENAKLVTDAQTKATTKMNAVLAALKALGVEDKDVQTTNYSSYPKYEYSRSVCPPYVDGSITPVYCPEGKQLLTGYEVSQSITVKVRKTEDAGKILEKVGSLDVDNISGLSFVIDDMDKFQAEARDKAIADAKQKAKELSKSLGVRLTRITSFYDNSGYNPYQYGMGGVAYDKAMSSEAMVAPVPQLPVGQNKVTASVSITYEVR